MTKLQTIRLVDAARFTERQPEPHQTAAWNLLQGWLTPEQVSEFAGVFRSAPKPAPSPTTGWLAAALKIIREFESFSASAYPDPGTGGDPWTIGWGSTFNQQGAPFRKGDKVSRAEADALLARDVNIAATAVDRALVGVDLNDNQKAALVSFTYNVGGGAFGRSTLVKRLQAGEDPNTVAKAELPRWNRGENGVLAGLARRRVAELALFTGQPAPAPLTVPAQQAVKPHLMLTRMGRRDDRGLDLLKLSYVRPGAVSSITVTSGAPKLQFFRTGAASRAGSSEPLPEGRWRIMDLAWAGGKDNWSKSWGEGLGPVSVPLEYDGPGRTSRSAIEIHIDWNATKSPGTAGCIGVANVADMRKLVGWLRENDPQHLYSDWGLGTCPKP